MMANDLYNKWQDQDIKYHYQRLTVKALTMPGNKLNFSYYICKCKFFNSVLVTYKKNAK